MKTDHKPTIETIINTAAIALTGSGVTMLTAEKIFGCLLVLMGAGLEFFKYWGRKNAYW